MSDLEKVVEELKKENEELKKENEELKKENEELKKKLGLDERPREEFHSAPPLQFNRLKDYWDWMKEQEEIMR
jgi:cell division protein FtsB